MQVHRHQFLFLFKKGKGLSIWDYSTHNYPEKFLNAANGDVAANSYFLYKEDVKALKTIGMTHHRFSISWPRILPNGDLSEINELGLQHYDDFINELLANGIQPLVTIFHYELPQKLEEIGGMLNPVIVKHFVNYAEILFKRYGDRVNRKTQNNSLSQYSALLSNVLMVLGQAMGYYQ